MMATDRTNRVVPRRPLEGHGPRVMLFGEDDALLSIRHVLLEAAGFRVSSHRSDAELSGDLVQTASAIILCHTIDLSRASRMIEAIRRINPKARFLSLTGFQGDPVTHQDGRVSSPTTPEVFLRTLRYLTGLKEEPSF